MDASGTFSRNRILAGLSEDERALLSHSLTSVDLPHRKMLEVRNRRIDHVYFLNNGLASVVASGGSNHAVEIALIGNEGMTGLAILLAAGRSPHETYMQSPGTGSRIAAADLHKAMTQNAGLREKLLHYAHTLTVQMGYTALANGRYKLGERLARWLLMAQDRSDSADIALTHESLAVMLGTRRPGITAALNLLVSAKMIDSERGRVTVLDRHALEEAANGSYGAAETEYARFFGAP